MLSIIYRAIFSFALWVGDRVLFSVGPTSFRLERRLGGGVDGTGGVDEERRRRNRRRRRRRRRNRRRRQRRRRRRRRVAPSGVRRRREIGVVGHSAKSYRTKKKNSVKKNPVKIDRRMR